LSRSVSDNRHRDATVIADDSDSDFPPVSQLLNAASRRSCHFRRVVNDGDDIISRSGSDNPNREGSRVPAATAASTKLSYRDLDNQPREMTVLSDNDDAAVDGAAARPTTLSHSRLSNPQDVILISDDEDDAAAISRSDSGNPRKEGSRGSDATAAHTTMSRSNSGNPRKEGNRVADAAAATTTTILVMSESRSGNGSNGAAPEPMTHGRKRKRDDVAEITPDDEELRGERDDTTICLLEQELRERDNRIQALNTEMELWKTRSVFGNWRGFWGKC
jgi:hypothetical protein